MILGIDEAGRGPWAGPLVVGAVVLGGALIEGLTDSKKVPKKKREALYGEVAEKALAYATGWVTATELDEIGMSEALKLATRRAVEQIRVPYSEIIIDGTINFLADTGKGKYVKTMPKADLLVPSVSAASIVAKVERDRYMAALDEKYEGYSFASHAGYGVAKHREAITKLGVTPEHRLSFAPLVQYAGNKEKLSLATRLQNGFSPGPTGAPAPGRTWAADVLSTERQTTRLIGDTAETVVANYLKRQAHVVLERNWKTKFCEIDIVSQKGDTVYFVEVKHRKNDKAGSGLAYITSKKLKQMQFAARLYAHNKRLDETNLRLMAVATTGSPPEVVDIVEIS